MKQGYTRLLHQINIQFKVQKQFLFLYMFGMFYIRRKLANSWKENRYSQYDLSLGFYLYLFCPKRYSLKQFMFEKLIIFQMIYV